MEVDELKGLLKFGSLRTVIDQGLTAEFGASIPPGVVTDVEQFLAAFAGNWTNNLGHGLALSRLRVHFKLEQNWMPIRKAAAKQLHRSRSWLDTLMSAANRAAEVDKLYLAALIEAGIDPTGEKYASIIQVLRDSEPPAGAEEARAIALKAIENYGEAKKAARLEAQRNNEAARTELGPRLAKQLSVRIKAIPAQNKAEVSKSVLQEIARAVEKQLPGLRIDVIFTPTGGDDSAGPKPVSRRKPTKKTGNEPDPAIGTLFDLDPVVTNSGILSAEDSDAQTKPSARTDVATGPDHATEPDTEPASTGRRSAVAEAQPLETAPEPVAMADQIDPTAISGTGANSFNGSTAADVAETIVETDHAPREPAAAASEHQRNQAGGDPGDHEPDPSGIPGKPPRRSRPRSTKSKLAPAQVIPNLFDPGTDGDMGQTRQDGSLLNGADNSSRESELVSLSIERSPSSPGSNPAAANRQATTVNPEDALRSDKHPTAALLTAAQRPSNFFATRCLDLFSGGASDATSRRIVNGDHEALLEMLDQDRPQRYLVPDLLGGQVHNQVILDYIHTFSLAEQHTVIMPAPRIDRLGTIQSGLLTRGRRWPRNLVIAMLATSIESVREKLQRFGACRLEQKCVAFLPFESHPHPYMVSRFVPDLTQILKTCGRPWVVVGGRINHGTGKNSLSVIDAGFIVSAAKDAGCKVFYSSAAEMLALEAGGDSAQLLEAIRLDSLADQLAGDYFRRYREIPDFPKRPARNAGLLVRGAVPSVPDLGSQQLSI